jgi:hypothetical protein
MGYTFKIVIVFILVDEISFFSTPVTITSTFLVSRSCDRRFNRFARVNRRHVALVVRAGVGIVVGIGSIGRLGRRRGD